MGSVDELEQYCGVRVTDLHREHVDGLEFALQVKRVFIAELRRCSTAGSNRAPCLMRNCIFLLRTRTFCCGVSAEFIAEGLDQTRGWFYTLTVLGAALFDKPAFRNVIVNGMVMAEDGKKMSKSLRNYTPPDDLMEAYGADALRLYAINSGLVKGEEQRFADAGVRDMVRRALLPWYNAFLVFCVPMRLSTVVAGHWIARWRQRARPVVAVAAAKH